MFTGKQERNGATGTQATHNPAQPGPDNTAVISAAMSAATAMSAYQMPIASPGMTVVDFEIGMTVHDQAGEA